MQKRLLLIICFFLSTAVMAEDFCFEFEIKKQGIKSIVLKSSSKKDFYDIKVTKGSLEFESSFYCSKKNSVYTCSGDDDSGSFEFNHSEGGLLISNMTLGEPDSETLNITKTSKILGNICK